MKKFYAIIAFVAASLMATNAKSLEGITIDFSNPIEINKSLIERQKVATTLNTNTSVKQLAFSRAEEETEEWETVGEGIMVDKVYGTGTNTVTIEKSKTTEGLYRIPNAWSKASESALPLILDLSNPDLVKIPDQFTGVYSETYQSEFMIFSYSFFAIDMNGIEDQDFLDQFAEVNITLKDGVINIPAQAILGIYPDSPIEDEESPISEAIFYANMSSMVIALPGAEYTPEWIEMGVGMFRDNLISPFYGYLGEDNPAYPVTIEKGNTVENEGMINLADAWSVWGIASGFVVDISNPDCIIIPMQYFALDENLGPIYFMSFSCNFVGDVEEGGMSAEQFIKQYPDNNITLTNGMINLPEVCRFFFFPYYDEEHLYTSKNAELGYIQLPDDSSAVKDIAVDSSNAAPVYYNLQGIQLQQPKAGQIVIVKQGDSVKKTVIR